MKLLLSVVAVCFTFQTAFADSQLLVVAGEPNYIRHENVSKLAYTAGKQRNAPWQSIDWSSLSEVRFGLAQVAQLSRAGLLTPEELQDSIDAFAFDLTENQKANSISGVPLNYFMGILRKGPYAAPANYESPQDRQRRLYLEAKEKQRRRGQDLEARLEAVEFEDWAEKLSVEQRAELVPPTDFAKPGSMAHRTLLRDYFRETVWPQVIKLKEVPIE
jgi:hypothetical protein